MNRRDVLLAAMIAAIWGLNFVAIHFALQQYPPIFLAFLRFALLAIPTLLFIRPPKVPLKWLLLYSLGFGIIQFVFLFLGMHLGMPAGLSSLVLQASAPFTVLLGWAVLKERISRVQWIGLAVALAGMGVIAAYRAQQAALVPLLLVLIGALGWALGNIASRQARPDSAFRFLMWMTVIPPLPLLAVSLLVEGPTEVWQAFTTSLTPATLVPNLGLLYIIVCATIIGQGAWTVLLTRNPSSRVAPFSMLVPVFGILSAWLILDEVPPWIELMGAAGVIVGVLLPQLAARRNRIG